MTELKREYVVPLRRKMRTAPKWRRSKKAVSVLKDFMRKHMKTEVVVICSDLNEYIWKCGNKNPPGKVSVVALKTDVNGTEKTIVSLADVNIDKQLESYAESKPGVATSDESKDKGVEDANVKEIDSKDEKNKSEEKQTEEADLEDKISESKDEPQIEDEIEMNKEKKEQESGNDEKEESKEVKKDE